MSAACGRIEQQPHNIEEASDKILTVANLISFIRLCLVPAYLTLLLKEHDVLAAVLFGVAAGTDFVDGQIARRTHTVSKLGQLLDPAVDRILMITGVLGVYLVGRVPLWVIVLVVFRDLLLLVGGFVLTLHYKTRVPVVFVGKVATTLLFVGFAFLLLNLPVVDGLGVCNASWLPGFNHNPVGIGIWFVYLGLAIAIFTTAHYVYSALKIVKEAKSSAGE